MAMIGDVVVRGPARCPDRPGMQATPWATSATVQGLWRAWPVHPAQKAGAVCGLLRPPVPFGGAGEARPRGPDPASCGVVGVLCRT